MAIFPYSQSNNCLYMNPNTIIKFTMNTSTFTWHTVTEVSTEWWWDDGSDKDHAPLQGFNHVLLIFDFW